MQVQTVLNKEVYDASGNRVGKVADVGFTNKTVFLILDNGDRIPIDQIEGVSNVVIIGKRSYRAVHWYVAGIIIWAAIWGLVISGGFAGFCGFNMFVRETFKIWFIGISFLCAVSLFVNGWIWRKPRSYENYKTEVDIIEFVERNVGPLIIATSVVILMVTSTYEAFGLESVPEAFIIYVILSLVFACAGVLPLYWIPSKEVWQLVRLRHIKTIPFFYAIFFFVSAILSFLLSILPH